MLKSKQKKIQFNIVDALSESGKLHSIELFDKLNYNIRDKKCFTKVDNALLSLYEIRCITKHIIHFDEVVYSVYYNGNHKDLGLFLDMVKTCCGSNKQKNMLNQLSDKLGINKQLSDILINTNCKNFVKIGIKKQ